MDKGFFGNLPIAAKLGFAVVVAVALVLGTAGAVLSLRLGHKLEERGLAELQRTNRQVIDMIETYADVLERSAEVLGAQFVSDLPHRLSLGGGRERQTAGMSFPRLRGGDTTLNNNSDLVDVFTASTGATATVFVRQNEDFFRIASSARNESGERALGTALDAKHPAYAGLVVGKPYTGRTTLSGRNYMTRCIPLKDDAGLVIGAACVGIDFTDGMAALRNKVLAVRVGETGHAFALDAVREPGMAMIYPTAEGKSLFDAKDADGRFFVREMIEKKQGIVRYGLAERGERTPRQKIAVIGTFEKWGWLVGTGGDVDELTRDLRELQVQFAVSAMLAAAVAAAVIFFGTRRWVGEPLNEAADVMRSVGDGNLSVSIRADGGGEVGRLLRVGDDMCERLGAMIAALGTDVAKLASDARTLAAASQQAADGSGEHSGAAAALATAVATMTAGIDAVAQHALEAKALAESSGAISESGAAVIADAIRGMESIAATVRESSAAVAQLGGQAQQITGIVNVIREIADQTNLLALNAAIEAARAGEQGRGFAVVADEVRKLAERTTQSTQEIADMVGQIQAGAQNAVDSMDVGVRQVEEGVALAGKAGDSIAEIKTGAARVGSAVIGISDTLREQAAASQDISHNVRSIANQAEVNYHDAQRAFAAAAALEGLADHLRHDLARFRT